ncbi:MAG: hypothetical protein QOF51_2465 [Chloroflexota bacterium]|jgi:hypothetical protein|nr:hypothetical protein [Chloroflexota bacterium]
MTGHDEVTHYKGANGYVASPTMTGAFRPVTCGHCGRSVHAAVIADVEGIYWLRCTHCHAGSVLHETHYGPRQSPQPRPGEDVEGLPDDIRDAWDEARSCAGAAAHTATEMVCRKILMHIAVDKGDREGQSFASYIDHLVAEGYVTKPMRSWVERIKDRANRANHDIAQTTAEQGAETLTFTGHLLKNVYEMEHLAQRFQEPEA